MNDFQKFQFFFTFTYMFYQFSNTVQVLYTPQGYDGYVDRYGVDPNYLFIFQEISLKIYAEG